MPKRVLASGLSESEVAQSCLTLCCLMDCSPPGCSIHEFSRREYWSGLPWRVDCRHREIPGGEKLSQMTEVEAPVLVQVLIWKEVVSE